MKYIDYWKEQGKQLKSHVYSLYRGIHDPRVPWYVKILTLLVIAYIISPVDIIPDFIPVLGLLDEIILVPVALTLIMRLVPKEIINEYQAEEQEIHDAGLKTAGVIIVLFLWISLILLFYFFVVK